MTAAVCKPLPERLPLAGLSALALAGFLTVLTEALPAGLLPQMSAGLGVSQPMVGQLITAYALGSLLTAIPLTSATRSWRRRPLLIAAITGFLIVNAVTALSSIYGVTLAARFAAGIFGGVVWSLLAGYAGRMSPAHLGGRAMAIVMIGIPLSLTIGIPAGTFLGGLIGWRAVFLVMSAISIVLIGWIVWRVPDFEGETAGARRSLAKVIALPGLKAVLAGTLGFVLAQNILYTYIAPFLERSGLADRVDVVLLVFGLSALVGIWITGLLIDQRLKQLALASTILFAAAALLMGLWGGSPVVVIAAVVVWGVGFGGAPTFLQTASARVAGDAADVAQSMIVTIWNLAIAIGGLIGGVLLQYQGAASLPWSLLALLIPTGAVIAMSRHGFRQGRGAA
nr:MFS transporter [uncultured Brevundimonas sp.]